jgi:NAD(P)H-flavin reductase
VNRLRPVKARIRSIKTEAEQVKTYNLSIKGPFAAIPGQFNLVGFPGVGESAISFSSVVRNGCFDHTIKAVGRVTGFLDGLKKGDELLLRGPYGKGWPLNITKGKDILLIAGGVGLAPLRPVVQKVLEKRELFGDVSIIYGARNEKNVLFMDEFDSWERGVSLFLTVDEVTRPPGRRGSKDRWKHNVGLVTDLLDEVKIKPENTIAFVCGPEIMMRFICKGLLMKGLIQSSIYVSLERRMKCGIAHCGHCQHSGLFVCKDGPVFSYKDVRGLPDGLL